MFGFAKLRYRGLNKNLHRLLVTCALANLFMARRHLLSDALCEPVSEVQFPFFEKSNPDFDGFMDHSGVVKHWFRAQIGQECISLPSGLVPTTQP